jgi:hypothetical protein
MIDLFVFGASKSWFEGAAQIEGKEVVVLWPFEVAREPVIEGGGAPDFVCKLSDNEDVPDFLYGYAFAVTLGEGIGFDGHALFAYFTSLSS